MLASPREQPTFYILSLIVSSSQVVDAFVNGSNVSSILVANGSRIAGVISREEALRNMTCEEFMKWKQQFRDSQMQMDTEIQAKLKEMNAATGDAKINVMAGLIGDLVNQRVQMHEHMAQMHENMAAMKERCPMMKGGNGKRPRRQVKESIAIS